MAWTCCLSHSSLPTTRICSERTASRRSPSSGSRAIPCSARPHRGWVSLGAFGYHERPRGNGCRLDPSGVNSPCAAPSIFFLHFLALWQFILSERSCRTGRVSMTPCREGMHSQPLLFQRRGPVTAGREILTLGANRTDILNVPFSGQRGLIACEGAGCKAAPSATGSRNARRYGKRTHFARSSRNRESSSTCPFDRSRRERRC